MTSNYPEKPMDIEDRDHFKTIAITSLRPLKNLSKGLPTLIDPPQISAERASFAAERAKLLFGLYRKGDASDAETYVAGITAVLAEYEPEVIRRVTDPREGIARKSKWMPSVAELSEECEAKKKLVEAEAAIAARGWSWDGERWVNLNERRFE
jgi:hypothetical protein